MNEVNTYRQITSIIHELGVPAGTAGHEYIRSAIMMVVGDRSITRAITKRLYPEIVVHYGITPQRAERATRYAIETGWNRGNPKAQEHYFGWTVNPETGKPTNGHFIATIADAICMEQELRL